MVARPGSLGFVLLTRDMKEDLSTQKTIMKTLFGGVF